LKRFDTGAFDVASDGIASLPLGLSAVWTEARRRGHTLIDVVRWIAESPSGQAGFTTKGHIAPGTPPTPRCSRPVEVLVVDKTKLHHKNPISAYDGLPLAGGNEQ